MEPAYSATDDQTGSIYADGNMDHAIQKPYPEAGLSSNDASAANVSNNDVITANDTKTATNDMIQISNLNRGWRRVVRNFTPSWFAVNMGTGIVSALLHNLPYPALWLIYISYIFFCLNILLFNTFLVVSILRYTLWPEIWSAMIQHPQQSLFVGTMPMGLATIVNMIVFVCVPAWGGGTWKLAWGLWWVDVVFSVATCFYLPFIM
jgi:hypothetical protein